MPNGEQPVTSNTDLNNADDSEVDYIITNDSLNDVKDALQQRNERLQDDVSKRNEATEAEKNEKSDRPDSAVCPKNQEKFLPNSSDRQDRKTMSVFRKKIFPMKTVPVTLQKDGMKLSRPKYRRVTIGKEVLTQTTQTISDTKKIEFTRKREFFCLFLSLFSPFPLNFSNK